MYAPLAGKRLLLVAEDADLAAVVGGALLRLGAEVRAAASGRAALDALARKPDAAVVDLPLPDLRGSELLAALSTAGVPAVVVSGVYRGARAASELRRLGARHFLEKPFAIEDLARAVSLAAGVAESPVDGDAGGGPTEATSPHARDERPVGVAELAAPPPPPPAGRPEPAVPRDPFSTPLPDTGGGRPAPQDDGRAPPPPRGDLARSSVPRLLVALHLAQATGALSVVRGGVRKLVAVERGAPVYAASSVPAERFGAICVRRGVVGAERLEALRREHPEARSADLLLGAGLLTPERQAELVAGQLRAIAWSTFEWREGTYEIQLGRLPPGRVPVRIPMGDLVLEGMRRASTLDRLWAELPSGAHLAPSPDPAFELYALRLHAPEAHLLALADGTKGVTDLVRLADMPERETLAFLQACRVMRILDEAERVLASTRRIGFM